MLLKARHLRHMRFHLAKLPTYVRGMRLMKRHLRQFGTVPRVVVVGAAGGGLDKWRPWAMLGLIEGAGFEPDPVACEVLRKTFTCAKYHQLALGNRSGPADLHVTAYPWCSSCLEPDLEALAPYSVGDLFKVEKIEQIALRRFDELCEEGVIRAPQFLQIDVQGYEYEVLEGFGDYLDELVGIELESHFTSIYKGQKALWEIVKYLKARGFVLRHLEPQGPFGGELVEVNAFFSRLLSPEERERRSLAKLWEWVCALPRCPGTREGLF